MQPDNRSVFSIHDMPQYRSFVLEMSTRQKQGIYMPAVYLFQQQYSLQGASAEVLRCALDATVSPDSPVEDLCALERLQLALMFLHPEYTARHGADFFHLADIVLRSTSPSSFRSRRLYSRAILVYFSLFEQRTPVDLVTAATSSLRLLYALAELRNQDTIHQACSLPIATVFEESLHAHFATLGDLTAYQVLYPDPVACVDALTTVQHPVLPTVALNDIVLV